jgi:hypothetical protein
VSEKLRWWILIAFLIGAPTAAVFIKKDTAGAAVLAAVGAAALLLTRLPDVSAFELLALKVKLERQSQQVEITLQQLQEMAAAFAQANLTELAMSDQRIFGLTTRGKFELHDNVVASMRKLKIPEDEILEAQQPWIHVYCRMILDRIEGIAAQLLPIINAEDEIEGLPEDSEHGLPSPKTLRNWIAAKSLNDAMLSKFVEEYENVWMTGTMQDPQLIPSNQVMKPRSKWLGAVKPNQRAS